LFINIVLETINQSKLPKQASVFKALGVMPINICPPREAIYSPSFCSPFSPCLVSGLREPKSFKYVPDV
jgi:hypothetical protein